MEVKLKVIMRSNDSKAIGLRVNVRDMFHSFVSFVLWKFPLQFTDLSWSRVGNNIPWKLLGERLWG